MGEKFMGVCKIWGNCLFFHDVGSVMPLMALKVMWALRKVKHWVAKTVITVRVLAII
jgi:hypothetical protein